MRHALPCHHFLHHRIQESLCPHQGPTHQPRSQTAWHPGLPSCGGHCSCPRSCSAAYCSPFSRIYAATVSLDGILLSFFSLSESRTASTSTRSTQNAQDDGCGRMLGCICCMSSRSMAGFPPYACCALSSAAPVSAGAASFAFDNVKRCVRRALRFVLLMRHGCGRRYNRCQKSHLFQRDRQLHGFAAAGLSQSFHVSIRSSISDVNRRSR